jgi:UDP-N-acetyl-D-mannosaminuronic acid transferase (WecB/TagA/CpsF family)
MNARLKESGETPTVQESEEAGIQMLAYATRDWDIVIAGETPECTREEAANLYRKYRWLREQVDLFCGARANFMPASARS